MLIITLKTDNPTAELALYKNDKKVHELSWLAHRELSVTIHTHIEALLHKKQKTLKDVEAVVVFEGPGSFTGLRIGLSVANALAYGLGVPIVGCRGDGWQTDGIHKLLGGENDKMVMPHYGSEPHITKPKK